MPLLSSTKRPVRIAGISGAGSDRRFAMARLAANYEKDPVDVLIGDWLSEGNMTTSAGRFADKSIKGAYERSFLVSLKLALPSLIKHGIKVVVNAGASDTAALYQVVSDLISKAQEAQIDHGHQEGSRSRKQYCAAWIEGDSVLSTVKARLGEGEDFDSLGDGPCKTLREWDFEPIFAHAYLGGRGIARALAEGADVVVCGRVSDASLVTGAALWWHGWSTTEHLDRLANAFIAGHLIECSSYVCGGNFTGFKALGERGQWTDIGFPIAEIGHGGEVIITKEKGSGGIVSVDTCTAQLVYEIQGPLYYNSDVTAVLDDIAFEPLGQNRVAVKGVRGLPPPRTTKVGLTARGGYQAEVHFYVVGLDAMEKVAMLEDQIRHVLKPYSDKFSLLEVTAAGVPAENPTTQISATVDVRVLVQARNQEDLSSAKFVGPVTDCQMQAYPGATLHLDLRMARPKPIFEYFVTLLPQNAIEHKVHLADGRSIPIDAPKDDGKETVVYPKGQKSTDSQTSQLQSSRFRKTIHGPLGWIVHARSGDKGANANVGLWVRNSDEYDWLKGLLSIQKIKELLAGEFTGGEIDRFELPNLRAVHFLLHNHLDRGASCTSSYDFFAKNVAEYLRARHVDIPMEFLARGKI